MSPLARGLERESRMNATRIRREARRRAREFAAQTMLERLEAFAERHWWVPVLAWGALALWFIVGRTHG